MATAHLYDNVAQFSASLIQTILPPLPEHERSAKVLRHV